VTSINLGILAHVDAGKTSLTERLLFESSATEAMGRVDDGTTRTDSMSLEQQRGITIRSAVTAIELDDLDINIIDTPGHSDFIAEVERALGVLDAAILVLSAVEGVQPQTVVLWRALRRIGVPTVIFINKVDRRGADPARVVEQLRTRLSQETVILSRATEVGTAEAQVGRLRLNDEEAFESIIDLDDSLVEKWAEGQQIPSSTLVSTLRRQVRESQKFPVVFGSAITGAGIDALKWVLVELLPTPQDASGVPSGVVFAVDHDSQGRRSWIRMWAGELCVRDRLELSSGKAARITKILVPTPAGELERTWVRAGDIAALRGPAARIGDTFGRPPDRRVPKLSPPTLQAAVTADDPRERGALFAGLRELADEDPLIGLDLDENHGNATVRLHGEVQREVIQALLEERFGIASSFEDTSVVCIETVVGSGSATEQIGVGDNPYLAGIGLELRADPMIDGVEFSAGVERGNLPASFISACEEGVMSALKQGLHGWQVTGCRVTLTSSGYAPRQSHSHQKFNKAMSSVGADFRNLAPVVTMACLAQARTQVCEPVEEYDLEVPHWAFSAVVSAMARWGATLTSTTEAGHYHRLRGFLRSSHLSEVLRSLPNLTGGEAVMSTRLDHYEPVVAKSPPARPRVGPDPRDRVEWFRRMAR
jgi:ribosomal protection tetracycline resistance protein